MWGRDWKKVLIHCFELFSSLERASFKYSSLHSSPNYAALLVGPPRLFLVDLLLCVAESSPLKIKKLHLYFYKKFVKRKFIIIFLLVKICAPNQTKG